MNGKKIFASSLLVVLFLIPMFSLVPTAQTPKHIVMYQQYMSRLMVTHSGITYDYSYTAYNTTNEQQSTISYTSFHYAVETGKLQTYTGNIVVTVSPFSINVTSQIPQLARVLLIEPNVIEEVVWAGFLNTTSTISGLAYFNSSAELVLQFLNGSTFANVTLTISHKTSQYVLSESLPLVKVSLQKIGEASFTLTVNSTTPERYKKIHFESEGVQAEAPYNVTVAYYNGTYVPAMIWEGEGQGSISLPSLQAEENVEFSAIEFFGINGSTLAYLENAFSSSYLSHQGFLFNVTFNQVESHIRVVINEGVPYAKAKTMSMVNINGNIAIVSITNNGVESTANVNFYHPVYIVYPASLVYVNVSGSGEYVIIYPNSSYVTVSVVTPQSVSVSNVTIGGKSYTAQVVNASGSGYIMFNVSLLRNESFAVFKQTADGMVELNPEDYFVYHGKVVVVDDPSTTYYVVYGYTSASSGVMSNYIIPIVGIIVVLVIVGAVLLLLKRK
ncbi:hypothetical protein [Stygiolobus azoricus]|uniref:Thermopsin n=1 Tax=Stygiolobus azoricus TaxID=41675 RepID=A0A650CPR9_9CREN|nr:hypothetical protein [Stygiolobus azoricus]QGR19840.1 hypothetical protein D1868_07525 [Stygiolobus azoricus]